MISTAEADAAASPRALIATATRPGTSPTSQRTVCRQERSRSLSAAGSRRRPAPPEVADEQGGDPARAEGLGRERGGDPAGPVADLGQDGGAGLDRADPAEDPVRRQGGEPGPFLLLGLLGPDPGLEPAFAGEHEAEVAARLGPFGRAVEVDRQEIADRGPVIFAIDEGVGPAEHEQAAAALGDEVPDQGELVLAEEAGLEVVDDDRVVLVQLLGRLGEAVAQLGIVGRAQPVEHRLVRAVGALGVGVVEPVEEGRGRPGPARLEVELGGPAGDPDQADELDLAVLGQGPAEELELPVGPAAQVEHPVRPAPLVHHDQAGVVGQGLLARGGLVDRARGSPAFSAEAA